MDTVEISEDGKVLLKESTADDGDMKDSADSDGVDLNNGTSGKPKADLEPVFYSNAGTVEPSEDAGTKVSVSV